MVRYRGREDRGGGRGGGEIVGAGRTGEAGGAVVRYRGREDRGGGRGGGEIPGPGGQGRRAGRW